MTEKDDKFILMNLDDKRSKKIAEVMGNETCKKIIDYLTDNSEKSEEDIANALNMKINTVEYNLKKLMESGLVEKTKNFFWSKRGKKIPLYKLAKKHIVISPRRTRPDFSALKTILPVIIIAAVIVAALILIFSNGQKTVSTSEIGLNKFQSAQELQKFLEEHKVSDGRGFAEYFSEALDAVGGMKSADTATAAAPQANSEASEYSQTNIQVAGVDEADIIKNDGKYIYAVTGNKVVIIDAYPAQNMEILSELEFNDPVSVGNIYINGDKLIVFTQEYSPIAYAQVRCLETDRCPKPSYDEPKTKIYIYDIGDRNDPQEQDTIELTGNYIDSRMIGDYVYVLTNQYIYDGPILLPVVIKNGEEKVIQPEDISYPDITDYSFQYTIIAAIDVRNGKTNEETILTGSTQNIFVSENNIYTTYTKYRNWYSDMDEDEKTLITKISIDKDDIEYVSSGEVSGHILNQFSMDEYDNNFRIATTISRYTDNKDESTNNVYVLDSDMNLIGSLEDVAPGESIYSVRFMGKRAYMVTFRHIDPLFVIDLTDPTDPTILGKLKIPGYSDYLHPYDENHIIGIGKEVDASIDADKIHTEGAVYYTAIQGVKISLFDVTDVEHPVEMYKVVLGDRGTESPATADHKAFLFDKAKELLVIPITLAELEEGQSKDMQGDYTFQGAYVYNLNLEDGFKLKGRITHYEDDEIFKKSGYYFRGDMSIQRSLYMDDTLYTFSNQVIKANNLGNLDEISSIDLPYEDPYNGDYPVLYRGKEIMVE